MGTSRLTMSKSNFLELKLIINFPSAQSIFNERNQLTSKERCDNTSLCFLLQNKVLQLLYDLVTSKVFEMGILGMIMLNMSVMMWQHYGQSEAMTSALHILFE